MHAVDTIEGYRGITDSQLTNRIVARVDQLMSLCDKLEAGLLRSQADSERLMEAVVGRILTGEDSGWEHGAE